MGVYVTSRCHRTLTCVQGAGNTSVKNSSTHASMSMLAVNTRMHSLLLDRWWPFGVIFLITDDKFHAAEALVKWALEGGLIC